MTFLIERNSNYYLYIFWEKPSHKAVINHNSLIVLSFHSHSSPRRSGNKNSSLIVASSPTPASNPNPVAPDQMESLLAGWPERMVKIGRLHLLRDWHLHWQHKVLRRSRHPLRSVEEVASHITYVTVFATFGARIVFWQIKLDYESSLLTTFNTPLVGTDSSECRLALLLHRRVSSARWKSCLLGIPMRSLWIACKPATFTPCRHH